MFLPLTTSERLSRRPWLVGAIACACTAMLVRSSGASFDPRLEYAFTTLAEPSRLFTYTFAHADWTHLVGNLFFLWTFGRLIEARWGRLLTAACFALTGAAGAFLHALAHPGATVLVGASGAIAGLAGAVIVALPNARFNRLFSPLFWPATPIVALARGRRWAALAELVPVYGWVLKLERGLPAFFVLPAWLSFDLFSMVASPHASTSFACHVGGALAGIGFGAAMRATALPERLREVSTTALGAVGLGERELDDPDAGAALSPAVRRLREASRPSRWPEGRASAIWFVLSLALAVGLMLASARATELATAFRERRATEAYRERLLATPGLDRAPFDGRYDHALFSVAYPSEFWACGAGRKAEGPCRGAAAPFGPNAGAVTLVRPDALESVHILALRGGQDRRTELVSAVASGVAGRLKDKAEWRLLEARNGTCHGEWSVESDIEIGDGERRVRMWSCAFSQGRDLYLYAFVVPETLRSRDEKTLVRILDETVLPAAKVEKVVVSAGADARRTSSTEPKIAAAMPQRDCPPGQMNRYVEGQLQCHRPEGDVPSRAGQAAQPRRTPARAGGGRR